MSWYDFLQLAGVAELIDMAIIALATVLTGAVTRVSFRYMNITIDDKRQADIKRAIATAINGVVFSKMSLYDAVAYVRVSSPEAWKHFNQPEATVLSQIEAGAAAMKAAMENAR